MNKRKTYKKILPFLIITVLFISGLTTTALSTNQNTITTLTKTITFTNLDINDDSTVTTITLKGTNDILIKPGYPQVPLWQQEYNFPAGTKIIGVHCTPKQTQTQILNKEFPITSNPVIIGQTTKTTQPQLKSLVTLFEYSVGMGIKNEQLQVILKIIVYPLRYSPEQKMITYSPEMDITIDYVLPEQKPTHKINDEYTFIILGPESFRTTLAPFIDHKINYRQISTRFVSLEDIYAGTIFSVIGRDNPEKIKYFIKNAIETWQTKYVLLVGSSDLFPVRITRVYIPLDDDNHQGFVSDLYYADIYNATGDFSSWDTNENNFFGEYNYSGRFDTVDLYPDVYLGRLAAVNTERMTGIINKIITYETQQAYTQLWFQNITVVGGDSFTGDGSDPDHVDEGEYANEATITTMTGFTPDRVWASNGRLSNPSSVIELKSALSRGEGFVHFSGHGNDFSWSTHPHMNGEIWLPLPNGKFNTDHIRQLTNGNKLPIVITSACSISKFNANPTCFSWQFINYLQGGGIASIGATGLGWGYTGYNVTDGCIEGIAQDTFKAYKLDFAWTFGQMWSGAIYRYIFPNMNEYDHKTIEEWEPFGDPTLKIAEEPIAPTQPITPEGPTDGKTDIEYSYRTTTTDVNTNEQLYYQFSWGDETVSEWVGPYSPAVNVDVSHVWTIPGTYVVTVIAKDRFDLESEPSESLSVSIQSNENHPPETPQAPTGSTNGEINIAYTYTTTPVTDPDEGDVVLYNFSFGDGTFSEWVSTPQESHTWTTAGIYEVKVKARDDNEEPAQSDWSEPLQVTIIKKVPVLVIESIRAESNMIIAVINNTGDAPASAVDWEIQINGGLKIFVNHSNGTIDSLAIGESKEVQLTGKVLLGIGIGIGKLTATPTIVVQASAPDAVSGQLTKTATIFFRTVEIIE